MMPGGRRGALVDRDPRQVELLQHVVLRAEDRAGRGQHAARRAARPATRRGPAGRRRSGPSGRRRSRRPGRRGRGRRGSAMPPPMPRVSGLLGRLVGGVDALGEPEGDARPRTAARSRTTARPLADSQPKKAAPHLMPPKRARWAATASRAAPRVAVAPSVRRCRSRSVACGRAACGRCRPWVGLLRAVGRGDPPAVGPAGCPGVPRGKRHAERSFARSGDPDGGRR